MTIAVDFDGTIVTHEYPNIGKELPFATDTLKLLMKEGHQLILWSVREGELLDQAIDWCKERGVEFYAINKDYPEETLGNNNHFSRKIKADIFIDDRNIGGIPDWGTIYRMISHRLTLTDIIRDHCISRDGLTPVLDAIREADGLIIGSPNYLSEMTASFRALYERLIFQHLTYNAENPCCNGHPIPVLLIMTSNAPDNMYMGLIKNYQQVLSRFVGPTEIFVSGDTLQLKDYGKTDWPWTLFDPESKKLRHETVFPRHLKQVFDMGAALVRQEAGIW